MAQDGGYMEYSADADYPEQGVEKGDPVRELILFDGDALLEPGQEYVFATQYDRQNERHHIAVTGSGDIEIGDSSRGEALLEKIRKAKDNQVDPTTSTRLLPNAEEFSVELGHGGHDHP